MTSTITVWTSATTSELERKVAEQMHAILGAAGHYDSVSLAGKDVTAAADAITGAFNRLVNMTMADSTLHIVAVVPLFDTESYSQLKLLHDVCSAVTHNITLHVVGLCAGLSHLFATAGKQSDASVDKAKAALRDKCSTSRVTMSYTLVDDYAANGAPIRFDIGSLAQYLCMYQYALGEDYYTVLSPSMVAAHQGENLSTGISALSFDRKNVVNRLLGMGFKKALEAVGINDKEVDAQLAVHAAEGFLDGVSDRYARLYKKEIHPLYKDDYTLEGEVVAKASAILERDIESLKRDILSLLTGDKYSLPEKEAILALILGRDNENLRGMQYEHEGKLLDDACDRSINLYVDAFNRSCDGSNCLPVRGDFDLLKKYVWDETEEDLVDSPENREAFNPLPFIKRLKQEIINTTSFMRERTDELAGLQNQETQRNEIEKQRRKWQRPAGDLKRVEYKEQPLSEKYTPDKGLKIKDAVDLRKYFSQVRNQEHLGSCTSFAAAAMYEAMMNRCGVAGTNEMSPAFLYYYSNVLKGRPEGGSNFYDQFEVMGTRGVCHETLYNYNPASPATPPSQVAVDDALSNRVTVAKQIQLADGSDKADTLARNHKALTAALSEGYPVGISLKVYDNFGDNGAFVLHPDDSPGAKEEGRHAMVIAGYSERDNFYIVRNSWGTEFGDNGYCYIPSAYIDDPDYNDFACIITEITGGTEEAAADVPVFIANFAATETEIRIAAIRNIVAKVRVELKSKQQLYSEYYKYYQRLMMQLTMPSVQNFIRGEAEKDQARHWINVDARKRELEESFVGKLKGYRHALRKSILYLLIASVILSGSWLITGNGVTGIMAIVSVTLTVFAWMGYKWWLRFHRRGLQEELDELATYARRQEEELMEMQVKFHVAGMWLKRFHKLSIEIGNVYDKLVSFNSTLRSWYKNYSKESEAASDPAGAIMFREIETGPLLHKYFEDNEKAIVANIDLMKIFEEYQISADSLDRLHESMRGAVREVIERLIGNFSVVDYLMGDNYPYTRQANLQEVATTLLNVGQPAYRNVAMNASTPVRILAGNVPRSRLTSWRARIAPYFPMQPVDMPIADPDLLILITIHPVE